MPKSVMRTQPIVVDEDVGRLESAVQHALRVRGREALAQLPADVGDLLGRQMAARRSSVATSSPSTSSIE